ncbi:hypothetical protein Tco_0553992 [Tanacetum coccineum]
MGGRSTLYCQGEELVLLVLPVVCLYCQWQLILLALSLKVSAAAYPDLWIVVLRIGKLQGIGEFSGVGFISTQQMVINSPCLTDTKNWLFQCKRHLLASPKQTALELAIPGQTATGKESSNPFMAGSLPKTIHFCDSLQSDEDKSLGDDASKQGRIDIGDIDTDAEITLIDETQGRINDIVADEDITLIPKLIIKQLKM